MLFLSPYHQACPIHVVPTCKFCPYTNVDPQKVTANGPHHTQGCPRYHSPPNQVGTSSWGCMCGHRNPACSATCGRCSRKSVNFQDRPLSRNGGSRGVGNGNGNGNRSRGGSRGCSRGVGNGNGNRSRDGGNGCAFSFSSCSHGDGNAIAIAVASSSGDGMVSGRDPRIPKDVRHHLLCARRGNPEHEVPLTLVGGGGNRRSSGGGGSRRSSGGGGSRRSDRGGNSRGDDPFGLQPALRWSHGATH